MIYKGANVLNEHKRKTLQYDGELEQITFLDRRVYKKEEGVYYPSVTTVLAYMPKAKFFEGWLKDVGHNADLIMRKAANEGTAVHDAVEDLIAGKEITWLDDFGNANTSLYFVYGSGKCPYARKSVFQKSFSSSTKLLNTLVSEAKINCLSSQ